jgi:hypothetical protein
MTTLHPELVTAPGEQPLITVGRVFGQDGMDVSEGTCVI